MIQIAGRTISFPKGDGSLAHNNRDFIANNVVPERTSWNRTYIKESVSNAYEKCFGEAVREYNDKQKRKDRKIDNYVKKIENSDNGENVFYENIVQLGTKYDTPVVDEYGNLTEVAKETIEVLEEYVKTFQERNPNLYLFNCVLHLDEATPHLHIDYIPVAHGYKTGMKIRNSLSKALQQMGFEKGKGRYDNETIAWEKREREYVTQLCQECGIEVEIKGDKRDNLTLPEYKDVMRKVEKLQEQAEVLDKQNEELEQKKEILGQQAEELHNQVQEKKEKYKELTLREKKLFQKIEKLEKTEKEKQKILDKNELRISTLKMIEKEVGTEIKKVKSIATPVNNFFGREEYVKVKKSDWENIEDAFGSALSTNNLLDKYENKIEHLEEKIEKLNDLMGKTKKFIKINGLLEAFQDFLKQSEKESIKIKLEEKKLESKEYNDKSTLKQQELFGKKKSLEEVL